MTRGHGRGAVGLATVAALLAACFELSGPLSSLSSVTPPVPAWPSVVIDDTLRDEAGTAAPLTVEAFDGSGQPVDDAQVTYIVLDTGLVVKPGGYVFGERVRTSPAKLVVQVRRGSDVLQTPAIVIDVVPRPDTVSPAGLDTLAATTYVLKGLADTTQVQSDAIVDTVQNKARLAVNPPTAGVRSWIVRYEITSPAPGAGNADTVFFDGASPGTAARRVSVDTTDPSGVSTRRLMLRTIMLPPPRTGRYHVSVTVTIRERGRNVPGSPIRLVVPFDIKAAP